MLHRFELTDALGQLPEIPFEGRVYRVTGRSADPTAPSGNGGRWAFPSTADGGCSVLYTSVTENGAIAEVASYLALSSPRPSQPLHLHTLEVSARRVIRLSMDDLETLGVTRDDYLKRNYRGTQEIGAALNFLGFDGLLVPSARWDCENCIIFSENHDLQCKLEKIAVSEIDWQQWALKEGLI